MSVAATKIEGRANISLMPKLNESFQALTINDSNPQIGHLCEICQQIPFKSFLGPQNQQSFRLHLDLVKQILSRKMRMECPMCHLIIRALEKSWTDIPIVTQTGGMGSLQRGEAFYISWRPGWPLITPQLMESMGSVESNEIVLRRCEGASVVSAIGVHIFCLGEEVTRGTSWMGIGGGIIGTKKFQPMLRLLGDDAHILELERSGHGRKHARVCETTLMAKWYHECKGNHTNCSKPKISTKLDEPVGNEEPNTSLLAYTRLIDVEKRCLVTIETETEFVALSYVWGNSLNLDFHTKMENVAAREMDSGLSSIVFPKTIADAINLTSDLGIRYLWIDSLCIVQDDAEKFMEISRMDVIYGLASLVLVAAAGADANVGLTGYFRSPRTEDKQEIQQIDRFQLMVSSPPLGKILSTSKWNTRGWTFQEWDLARRALVFTDQQVYYVCSNSNFSEDIYDQPIPPTAENSDDERIILPQVPNTPASQTGNSEWTEYQHIIESYTPRELTHESDTLLAISGLLANLHRTHGSRFLCGVSVENFQDALFWVTVNGTGFRGASDEGERLFPTWSWAGWKGAVRYGIFPASEQCLIERLKMLGEDGEEVLFEKPLLGSANERSVIDREQKLASETLNSHEEGAEKGNVAEALLFSNYLAPCHLVFEAPSAFLQISPGIIDSSSSDADALVNLESRMMGVALLNTKTKMGVGALTRQWETYLCVAISTSKTKMSYTLEKAYSKLPLKDDWVNVILVSRNEDVEDEVYFRAGVGQVSKWRWDNYATAEMRKITLG